ncbi:MAG: putative quinol monooxygenase [Ruminococcus callidus]
MCGNWTSAFGSPHSWRNERRTHNETTPSGHYTAKPGQRDAFLRAVAKRRAGNRPAGGRLSAVRHFLSAERPDEILLIRWASAEQQQTHLRQPHMQQLKQQKEQYIAETDVQTLGTDFHKIYLLLERAA